MAMATGAVTRAAIPTLTTDYLKSPKAKKKKRRVKRAR